jgi:hypothetical protein
MGLKVPCPDEPYMFPPRGQNPFHHDSGFHGIRSRSYLGPLTLNHVPASWLVCRLGGSLDLCCDRDGYEDKPKRNTLRFHTIDVQKVNERSLTTVSKEREARREEDGNDG